MTNPASPPAFRSVQFWIGLCLLGVGLLGSILAGDVFLKTGSASRALRGALVQPIREDLLNAGVSPNIAAQVIRGITPPEDELGNLTPHQKKKVRNSVTMFESVDSVISSARIGAVIGLGIFSVSAALGLWLIRRRKAIFIP